MGGCLFLKLLSLRKLDVTQQYPYQVRMSIWSRPQNDGDIGRVLLADCFSFPSIPQKQKHLTEMVMNVATRLYSHHNFAVDDIAEILGVHRSQVRSITDTIGKKPEEIQ